MRKMIMVLMMVFGLSAAFADSYVAFTSEEGLELYNGYDNTEFNNWVKSYYNGVNKDATDKEKKNSTLIIIIDDQCIIHYVWVDIDVKNPKIYWVYTGDFDKNGNLDENSMLSFKLETSLKTDPVTVGLSLIKENVIQINNVNKEKVVYTITEYN